MLKFPDKRGNRMPNIRSTNHLWVLICAFALVIGLAAAQMALAEESSNTQSLTNFREDYPLKEIRGKTFQNETVQIDGNAFVDCTFDNVTFRFDGKAPFRFTTDHFPPHSKFNITSNNPVVIATMELMNGFIKLGNPAQNQPQGK
jgi:hypothetical protein